MIAAEGEFHDDEAGVPVRPGLLPVVLAEGEAAVQEQDRGALAGAGRHRTHPGGEAQVAGMHRHLLRAWGRPHP